MSLPKLNRSERDREYKQRNFEEIAQIVYTWLFKNDISHRDMDRDILGLDSNESRGWQSMGVLHFLGLKAEFKGVFLDMDLSQAIEMLGSDNQDFSFIIELLESTLEDHEEALLQSLYETGKSQDINFEDHYKLRLSELADTDAPTAQGQSRKEQSILRSILFKGVLENRCAICHRTFPIELMVAAHIKPRSKCSTSERKNANVVMPVCKVGCDEFFEKGYITVDKEGLTQINDDANYSDDLRLILKELIGKKCIYFNQDTADFFAFKRESFSHSK